MIKKETEALPLTSEQEIKVLNACGRFLTQEVYISLLVAKLVSRCKNSVSIRVNTHKDYNEPVRDYIEKVYVLGHETLEDGIEEIGQDVYNKMIDKNTVVEIQAYTETSGGFLRVIHYDFIKALKCICSQI